MSATSNPYVYVVRNLVNNKIYVGKGTSPDPYSDDYLGSGIAIKAAIRKHGRKSFVKEILQVFAPDEEHLAFKCERTIVDESFVKRDDTYNLTEGGLGFTASEAQRCGNIAWEDPAFRERRHDWLKRRWNDSEYRARMTEITRQRWASGDLRQEVSEKRSEAMRRRWSDENYRTACFEDTSKQMSKQWEDPEFRRKQTERVSKQTKGRIWIFDPALEKSRMIWPDELEECLARGCRKGRR